MLNNWRNSSQSTVQFREWAMFITSVEDEIGKMYGYTIKDKTKGNDKAGETILSSSCRWDDLTAAKEACEIRFFQYLKDQIKHYQSCLHSFEEDTNS